VPKIAKQIVVCLFALLIPAYLMRDQPKDLLVLIPVGMVAILNLMFFDSPKAISWAKARIKAFVVGCVGVFVGERDQDVLCALIRKNSLD
jgi:CBS-domain-containing membrane protein